MKTVQMSTEILAMIIDGMEIEDIFLDETGRFEVNPREYYGLTSEQVDLFLFHVWYNETYGKLLSKRLVEIQTQHGSYQREQAEYRLFKEYEKEWNHVRKQYNLI
jgi:ribosome biogenesis SPOUT family RNA methylase Rps3